MKSTRNQTYKLYHDIVLFFPLCSVGARIEILCRLTPGSWHCCRAEWRCRRLLYLNDYTLVYYSYYCSGGEIT